MSFHCAGAVTADLSARDEDPEFVVGRGSSFPTKDKKRQRNLQTTRFAHGESSLYPT